MVGWLAAYPDPNYEKGRFLNGDLVLYQNGRILHEFSAPQVFWDWQFRDGGKRVAYSTGPTHGGAAQCVLRDVHSGRVISRWLVTSAQNGGTSRFVPPGRPPTWAETLRY